MKVLFLHPNIPGQYKHVARALGADPANQVVFITKPRPLDIPGVIKMEYQLPRDASPQTHRYITGFERAVLQGQEVWRMCKKLKQEGFVPDVICAHPGWGDALYLKDIFPQSPLINYFEFYYHSEGADVGFDPATTPLTEDDRARIRTKNTTNLLSLESADWGISPTWWQFQQHPKEFQSKISVLHDGIDVEQVRPYDNITVNLPGGKVLGKGDEIVTYVARNFEPYRGFHIFMQAAEEILARRPNCHIIAVGADDVSYGRRPPAGTTYRQLWMDKVKLDSNRIHFPGPLDYGTYLKILQVSSAHIYLTYPFVLSWSMMEAMAAGCLIIGSDTAPVSEVIQEGRNGLLVDFFSPKAIADRVDEVFAHPNRYQQIRHQARQTIVERYALSTLLPLQLGLIRDIAERKFPPPTQMKINRLYDTQRAA